MDSVDLLVPTDRPVSREATDREESQGRMGPQEMMAFRGRMVPAEMMGHVVARAPWESLARQVLQVHPEWQEVVL